MAVSLMSMRGFFISLFFFVPAVFYSDIALASYSKLDADSQRRWDALIHYRDAEFFIKAPEFLLSVKGRPDPSIEFDSTIKLLHSNPQSVCNFPARYLFLDKLGYISDDITLAVCKDYQEYKLKAPADELSIVYASEKIASASSMLGHAMFSMSGKRQDGYHANHTVSFFTEIDSFNIPKIAFQTLVSGEKGLFLLSPQKAHYEFYRQGEQRNVWRYKLNLNDFEKELVAAHFWELKHPDIEYFFHTHNCATLVLDILRVGEPGVDVSGFITPLDVVKEVHRTGLIDEVDVRPSSRWMVKLLQDKLSSSSEQKVYRALQAEEEVVFSGGETGILEKELYEAGRDYLYEMGEIELPEIDDSGPPKQGLNLADWLAPQHLPLDAQLSLSRIKRENDAFTSISWLPVGHGLQDNNRRRTSESETKIFEVEALYSEKDDTLKIDKLLLYSAKSIIDNDPFTGGISGSFELGYLPSITNDLTFDSTFKVSAGAGLSQKLLADVQGYFLANIDYDFSKNDIILRPELGMFVYEVFDMKSWVRFQREYRDSGPTIDSLSATQSWYINGNHTLSADYTKHSIGRSSVKQVTFSWTSLF